MLNTRLKPGFTIVELIVVIVVLSILAAIVLVAYSGVRSRAIDSSMKSDLENSSKILGMDYATNSFYPVTAAAANSGKGLNASNGSTLSYTPNNSTNPTTYILNISNPKSSNSYGITNADNTPTFVTGASPAITYPVSSSVSNSDGCGGSYYYFGLYSAATGTPTPVVQWQRLNPKNSTSGTWVDITGATSSSYSWDTRGTLLEPDYDVFRAVWKSGAFTSISPTMQIALTNGC
jgi:prepilin-type N-terminal cleavage/methylation domain-containing protein